MKKYKILLLALALPALVTLAFSQIDGGRAQQTGASPVAALRAKRESVVLRKEQLRKLLSAVGVGVEEPSASSSAASTSPAATASSASPDAPATPATPASLAAPSYRGLKIRLDGAAALKSASARHDAAQEAAQDASKARVTLLEERRRVGSLARQRSLELSSEQILVLTLDARAQLRWWTLVADPRIVRAEEPQAGGELKGQVLFQPEADLLVDVPDDAGAVELRFYHPRWTGEEFALELLGTLPLGR